MHNAAVAVAVGDEDVASRCDRHVGRSIEVSLVITRFAPHAKRHQPLAFGSVLLDDVQAEVGNPDVPFVIDPQLMRVVKVALAPRANERAISRVALHRVRSLAEEPDIVVLIDREAGDPAFVGDVIGFVWPCGVDVVLDEVRFDCETGSIGGMGNEGRQSDETSKCECQTGGVQHGVFAFSDAKIDASGLAEPVHVRRFLAVLSPKRIYTSMIDDVYLDLSGMGAPSMNSRDFSTRISPVISPRDVRET